MNYKLAQADVCAIRGFFVSFLQFTEKALLLRRSKAFIKFEILEWLFFALSCVT